MQKFKFDPQEYVVPPLMIDKAVYDQFAKKLGEDWAYSYLLGATITNRRLIPRTQTAWQRILDNETAMDLLAEMGVALVKPPPFEPDRTSLRRAA